MDDDERRRERLRIACSIGHLESVQRVLNIVRYDVSNITNESNTVVTNDNFAAVRRYLLKHPWLRGCPHRRVNHSVNNTKRPMIAAEEQEEEEREQEQDGVKVIPSRPPFSCSLCSAPSYLTALMIAASANQGEVIHCLLSALWCCSISVSSAYDIDMTKLMDVGIDRNDNDSDEVVRSARSTVTASVLVRTSAPVGSNSALHFAASRGAVDAVHALLGTKLRSRSEINTVDDSVGCVDSIRQARPWTREWAWALLCARNASHDTPLMLSAALGETETTQLLIDAAQACSKQELLLEQSNEQGVTALMCAARSGSAATVRVMLEAGAKIGAIDSLKRSVYFYAKAARPHSALDERCKVERILDEFAALAAASALKVATALERHSMSSATPLMQKKMKKRRGKTVFASADKPMPQAGSGCSQLFDQRARSGSACIGPNENALHVDYPASFLESPSEIEADEGWNPVRRRGHALNIPDEIGATIARDCGLLRTLIQPSTDRKVVVSQPGPLISNHAAPPAPINIASSTEHTGGYSMPPPSDSTTMDFSPEAVAAALQQLDHRCSELLLSPWNFVGHGLSHLSVEQLDTLIDMHEAAKNRVVRARHKAQERLVEAQVEESERIKQLIQNMQ